MTTAWTLVGYYAIAGAISLGTAFWYTARYPERGYFDFHRSNKDSFDGFLLGHFLLWPAFLPFLLGHWRRDNLREKIKLLERNQRKLQKELKAAERLIEADNNQRK